MTTAVIPLVVACAVVAAELLLWVLVGKLRKDFQWLITSADIRPQISSSLVERHMATSFDPDLGWVRRPGTSGSDVTAEGRVEFRVDDRGCRNSPGLEALPARIAVFGDSYAFCRLVRDTETWPHVLGQVLGANVLNFGVGNYGLDQALLRFERELPNLKCQVVIMCVVPETIARVHSYWKHYFEYGNVLAFKPRFTESGGGLSLHRCAIQKRSDYDDYPMRLEAIQQLDHFFQRKFLRDVISFPYLFSIARRAGRYVPMMWHLLEGRLTGDAQGWRRAFSIVLTDNARIAGELYSDPSARALMAALIGRFRDVSKSAGIVPMLLVIPQPSDLARIGDGDSDYGSLFRSMQNAVAVVDLTDAFRSKPARETYVEGALGPHVSAAGNRMVATSIAPMVKDMMSGRDRAA